MQEDAYPLYSGARPLHCEKKKKNRKKFQGLMVGLEDTFGCRSCKNEFMSVERRVQEGSSNV